jgi:hypothetical protein
VEQESAPVAVANTKRRVTVAADVQPARAMTDERMVVDALAA